MWVPLPTPIPLEGLNSSLSSRKGSSLAIVTGKKKKKLRDHKLPMVPFQRGEEPHSSKWFPSKEEKSHILSRGFGVTTSWTETSSLPMTPGYFGMGLTHTLPELTGCNWVVISSQAFRVSVIYTKVTCQLLIVFLKAIHNVNFQMLHLYLNSSC